MSQTLDVLKQAMEILNAPITLLAVGYLKKMSSSLERITRIQTQHTERFKWHGERFETHEKRLTKVEDKMSK
jgi:hypothetical protein